AAFGRAATRRLSQDDAEARDEVLEHLLSLDKQRQSSGSNAAAAGPPLAAARKPADEDPLDIQDLPAPTGFPHHIFRAYDIRGLAHSELTAELVMQIGKA